MADIRALRKSKKYKYYICALVATNKTGEALEYYTMEVLESVHNDIRQRLGDMTACCNQCSHQFRNQHRWCFTCKAWKEELVKYLPLRIKLRAIDLKSWKWPLSARDIAGVFIPHIRNTHSINLKDVSTVFTVWNTCTRFPRSVREAADPLRRSRNELTHTFNVAMKITSSRKDEIFKNICNVLNHRDIQPLVQNHDKVISTIEELEKGDLFRYEDDITAALVDIGLDNVEIKNKLDETVLGLERTNKTLNCILTIMWLLLILAVGIVFVWLCPEFRHLNTHTTILELLEIISNMAAICMGGENARIEP